MKKYSMYGLILIGFVISCSQQANGDNYASSESGMSYEKTSYPEEESGYVSNEADVALTAKQSIRKDIAGNNGESKISTDDLKQDNPYNSKIIRTADLKIKVENVKKSSTKIANLVDMKGGYISSEDLVADKDYYQTLEKTEKSQLEEYKVEVSNVIYIRVPSENFQSLLSDLKGVAISEDYIKVNAQDVTEEYFDLTTRLKTKKEVEQRYIEILRSKARTVEEILIAEEKIRVIREEIEAVEGRLKYLSNKVNLSSIQVELYQDPYFVQEEIKFKEYQDTGWSFWEKAGNALSSGWNAILMFLVGLLYFWPLLLIGGAVFWFVRKKLRKKKA
ncbi:MAG: DUF4349 domain-containing protein [Putridiphycobacter sp.]